MQVARWGNSLAIRIPAAVVEALELKEGDDIDVRVANERTFELELDHTRAEAMETIRRLSRPLPPGWKFDREEANAR